MRKRTYNANGDEIFQLKEANYIRIFDYEGFKLKKI